MDTIEGSGFPLGFALDDTDAMPIFLGQSGETVVTTEVRMMARHQKEAIVHEGPGGRRWRLTSDEGKHLNGADMTYPEPPAPPDAADPGFVRKAGVVEDGKVTPAPVGTTTRIIRTVTGQSRLGRPASAETDTWLEMPGVSHFKLASSWAETGRTAPSGLALFSAGIAYCFLTQLSRYILHLRSV